MHSSFSKLCLALCKITRKLHVFDVSVQIKTDKLVMLYVLEFMLVGQHFIVKIIITGSSGSMNDSKWPAISMNALPMFENALTMFWNDFEMDLQHISVPFKNIDNVSKCSGNALQCISNTLKKCIATEKCYNAIFVKPAFPKEGHKLRNTL